MFKTPSRDRLVFFVDKRCILFEHAYGGVQKLFWGFEEGSDHEHARLTHLSVRSVSSGSLGGEAPQGG